MKTLKKAPTEAILAEIAKFQRQQKRYPATSEISQNIGEKLLAPLFAEMARRQREEGNAAINAARIPGKTQ